MGRLVTMKMNGVGVAVGTEVDLSGSMVTITIPCVGVFVTIG